ncbi:MAG TPA: hypothetical protein VGK67_02510 [Myxococcales bacterium]|jgi:predicted outer membrane lipoprotein
MLIFGKRLFGRVDEVQGVFYVAPLFGHLFYFPLVPLQTWLLVSGSEHFAGGAQGEWTASGIPIPTSAKSVLFGWARGFLLAAAFASVPAALQGLLEDRTGREYLPPWGPGAVIAACLIAFALSRPLSRPGVARLDAMIRRGLVPLELIEKAERALGRSLARPMNGFQPSGGQQNPAPGAAGVADLEIDVEVSFQQAFLGAEIKVGLPVGSRCRCVANGQPKTDCGNRSPIAHVAGAC